MSHQTLSQQTKEQHKRKLKLVLPILLRIHMKTCICLSIHHSQFGSDLRIPHHTQFYHLHMLTHILTLNFLKKLRKLKS